MGAIYRNAGQVVICVGEEFSQNQTRQAYDLLLSVPEQMKESAMLSLLLRHNAHNRLEPLQLSDGTLLRNLDTHSLWPGIRDMLASPTVFGRLWTVQEMALPAAGRIMVQYGSATTDWGILCEVITIVLNCSTMLCRS